MARYFDPQKGVVRIGGVDARQMDKETRMNTVSFVFQNSRLLKASILENVRLGRPSATREEVLRALDLAQCRDILDKLPQGMDTVIGAGGTYLSGGGAAAHRHRPGDSAGRAHRSDGRGHGLRGPRQREQGPSGFCQPGPREDGGDDCPPPVHRAEWTGSM